jgi:hypothetical protein
MTRTRIAIAVALVVGVIGSQSELAAARGPINPKGVAAGVAVKAAPSGPSNSGPSSALPGLAIGGTSKPSGDGGNVQPGDPAVSSQILRNPGPEFPPGGDDFTSRNIR